MNNVLTFQRYFRENDLFSRFNLKRIGLFGSYARNEEDANDIDILIEEDIEPEKLIELKELLEKTFQKKIDMVLKKFANPIILHRAKKDMQYATEY